VFWIDFVLVGVMYLIVLLLILGRFDVFDVIMVVLCVMVLSMGRLKFLVSDG